MTRAQLERLVALAARVTAAKAVLADFRRADSDYLDHGGERPCYFSWAHRLDTEMACLLDQISPEVPGG
jgi:hypothetical protein